MSDDEDVHSGEEEEETKMAPPEDSGPSEAERAMQKRRQGGPAKSSDELDEDAQELLEANRLEREKMEEEIQELRERSQQRKKEREEQEREMAERRSEEESRRKQEEEDRKNKKDSEDNKRREARDQKMAEFDKFKNVSKPNFVISKRDAVPGVPEETADDAGAEKKSKEQVEAEKRAILAQRIQPLDISGFDAGKLTEKAKELNTLIYRLESDKYDLEKRFKEQQFDMMELADKARQMNQVGRGGLKRIQLTQDESDPIQEKFAGAPSKIVMFSQFERQMDKRKYTDRHDVFHGPTWVAPPDRIAAYKNVIWDENTGLPSYQDIPGMERPAEEGEEEE